MQTLAFVVGIALSFGAPQSSQTRPAAAAAEPALASQAVAFDYLLGDWEFSVDSKEFGKGRGFWSAVRLPGGPILDEFRVLDAAGETTYVTTTLRAYNAALDRWELVGMHPGTGLQNTGTGQRVGDEIHITQQTGSDHGVAVMARIRYYDIRPDRFSWIADRSRDAGKTWTLQSTRIEARRIGPARDMGPLAVVRK